MRVVRGKRAALEAIGARNAGSPDDEAADAVRGIVAAVRREGDAALRELGTRFGDAVPRELRVPSESLGSAAEELSPELSEAIRLSAARIEAYYRRQPAGGFLHGAEGEGLLGQLVRPIERVGCYVPGGTAPLFSSLLMTAVPARVAGVPNLVVATPPGRDGTVAAEIRFVAHLLGIDTVVAAGGAQAIAALAYGTESVPRVDKVVGPGNRYVMAAKRLVFGTVGIEALPGPTETLVIADADAEPAHVIADLLAQAEHAGAQPLLVTPSEALAESVRAGLEPALDDLPTAETARASLQAGGFLAVVADLREAVEVANAFAPEHLCLLVRDPWSLLDDVRNAGGVFLGAHSMEALGDYLAGPSHVMPTGGTARFASFVNLRDFQKVIPILSLSPGSVARLGPAAARMARAEGLEAHARAIEARGSDE